MSSSTSDRVHASAFLALLLLAAGRALAGPTCETVGTHPTTGEPTTLSVRIDSPEPGSTVAAFADTGCGLVVRGVASAVGDDPRFDFYVVVDTSGSTTGDAGADVDGDGASDDILAAEVAAARRLLEIVSLGDSRIALLTFSDDGRLQSSLSADADLLNAALDDILERGSGGYTNYASALSHALEEHARRHDPTREQVVLFLSDGFPTTNSPPPSGGATWCPDFPDDDACRGILWAEEAGRRGLVVETFAVGTGADLSVLAEMSRRAGGEAHAVTLPADIVDLLPEVSHVDVDHVTVTHALTHESVTAALAPDGAFSAALASVPGTNAVDVTAVATSGLAATCATSAETRCIQHGCPQDVAVTCEDGFGAHVHGLVAWADHGAVVITSDSAFDDAPLQDDDASGRYPLGTTTVSFSFEHSEAGVRECQTRVTVLDGPPLRFPRAPGDVVASCDAVPPAPTLAAEGGCGTPSVTFREERRDGACPGNYELQREWVATDGTGRTARHVQRVRVVDDVAPVLLGVPQDAVVECDSVPPPAAVAAFDACDPAPRVRFTESREPGACPDDHVLVRQWTAEDACGLSATAVQRVTVVDTTPPVVVASGLADFCAWPPRHGYATLDATVFAPQVTDNCTPVPTWRVVSCASSQPEDALGDGHTADDCAIAADGRTLSVRVERQGGDLLGRRYVVSVVAADACGNVSLPTPVGSVFVPHDQSRAPKGCRGGGD